jgi:pimeloyl-ACP methyl ester carboxylesterase
VLRYDKRGIGDSKGDYASATGADFAADASGALAWLRDQPGISAGNVGLIGHSEGAEIAPEVANADAKVAFVVLLAAPAVPGAEIIAAQQKAILLAGGVAPAEVEKKNAIERRLLGEVRRAPDEASAINAATAVLRSAGVPSDAAAAEARQVASPWFRAFLNDDPAPALRLLRQPVLVISGSKDLQVLPDQNLPVIRKALAGNKGAKIVELPGLNHLLQPAKTGAPSEYGTIATSVDPAALDLISEWVTERRR